MYRGFDLWVLVSLVERGFSDLTDLPLADEDTNYLLGIPIRQSQAISN